MADAELHIHCHNPIDTDKLSGLLNAAVEAKGSTEVKVVVPEGYRCVECYDDDGGHSETCSIYMAQKRKIKS